MQEPFNNILFLHGSNDLYGASKVLLKTIDSIEHYDKTNLHVILPYKGVLDKILKEKGVRVTHINLGVLRRKYFNFPGLLNRIIKILKSTRHIQKYIKENNIDLIYTNTSVILSGGIAARLTKRKSLFHIHETPAKNGLYQKLSGYILDRLSDKVITVSNVVSEHWMQHIAEFKIRQIYNSIEIQKVESSLPQQTDMPLKIISVGRLHPLKGHEYLLEIVAYIKQGFPKIKLEIIGDIFRGYEEYEKSLLDKRTFLGLENEVSITGFEEDMDRKYKNANFLIHPSILPDSLPTVILEAMSYSIPVAATDLGGAKELINNNENGLLIPSDNAEDASEKLLEFFRNLELQKRCVENAKNNLRTNFDSKSFKADINDIINDLCSKKTSSQ